MEGLLGRRIFVFFLLVVAAILLQYFAASIIFSISIMSLLCVFDTKFSTYFAFCVINGRFGRQQNKKKKTAIPRQGAYS